MWKPGIVFAKNPTGWKLCEPYSKLIRGGYIEDYIGAYSRAYKGTLGRLLSSNPLSLHPKP